MNYLDGFLLPCSTTGKDRYAAVATAASKVFRKHGAIECVEAWADDVPDGKLTSMPMAVKKTDEEAVVFSWISWPDKATRDAGMQKTMEDEELKAHFTEMPFDGMRMMFGGFTPVVDVPGPVIVRPGNYIDGLVAAVPNANRESFIEHARKACEGFVGHGALRCVETWADDVPDGKVTSFPMSVKKEADESVVFSFILWADKAARDAGWAKIMADPALQPDPANPMPFDGKRMIFGGFVPIVTN